MNIMNTLKIFILLLNQSMLHKEDLMEEKIDPAINSGKFPFSQLEGFLRKFSETVAQEHERRRQEHLEAQKRKRSGK